MLVFPPRTSMRHVAVILFQQAQLPPLNRNLCPIRGVRQNRSLFAAEGTEIVLNSELKKSY